MDPVLAAAIAAADKHTRVVTSAVTVADPVLEMLAKHVDFLEAAGKLRVQDMMGALREYAQVTRNSSCGAAAAAEVWSTAAPALAWCFA